jgi:hypothetical protein
MTRVIGLDRSMSGEGKPFEQREFRSVALQA